ncbi:unnamed protein product [Candidula unifasciata]|uniref:Vesicular, overexpressed in cancer, prosurvival protein 1 n=1 Tax=Candidula unifasciata TaxID=100452 RepID=A0A8S3YRG1_9EUPU|nr:unnamed protein product [Candidula unifasciata]
MVWLTVTLLLALVCEVFSDYCEESIFCDAPYKCCEMKKGCCYDSMLHSSKHFRLQIWNMWYFWFLVIFMMMSCFGGCGYYRRRRLAMLTRTSHPSQLRTATVLEPVQRRSRCRSTEGQPQQFNFFAYIGSGVSLPPPVSNLPPAYAEVISQPSPYPYNKVELPPYPGSDKPEDHHYPFTPLSSTVHHHDTTMPPPYNEYYYGHEQPPLPVVPSGNSAPYIPPQPVVAQVPSVPAERDSNITPNSTIVHSNHQ